MQVRKTGRTRAAEACRAGSTELFERWDRGSVRGRSPRLCARSLDAGSEAGGRSRVSMVRTVVGLIASAP
jgi:hypothetical protein